MRLQYFKGPWIRRAEKRKLRGGPEISELVIVSAPINGQSMFIARTVGDTKTGSLLAGSSKLMQYAPELFEAMKELDTCARIVLSNLEDSEQAFDDNGGIHPDILDLRNAIQESNRLTENLEKY